MSRIQKKCLVASMGIHVLLGVCLLVGAAFAGRHKEDEEVPPMMTLIPSRLVDALASGGGNPNLTTPPAPAPQVSQPVVAETPKPEVKLEPKAEEPVSVPEPRKIEPPKPEKAEPKIEPKPNKKSREPEPNYEELISNLKDIDQTSPRETSSKPAKPKKESKKSASTTPNSESKKHEIKVNLNAVKTTGRSAAEIARANRQRAEAVAKQRAALEAYRQALEQRSTALSSVLNRLDKGLSTGTSIEISPGGEAFANYGLYVRSKYDSVWNAPLDAPEDSAKVQIRVVVARDGTVVASEITSKSGNPALDKSVQRALNAVRQFPPFPAESNDRERVFIINFDLKAKRQIG